MVMCYGHTPQGNAFPALLPTPPHLSTNLNLLLEFGSDASHQRLICQWLGSIVERPLVTSVMGYEKVGFTKFNSEGPILLWPLLVSLCSHEMSSSAFPQAPSPWCASPSAQSRRTKNTRLKLWAKINFSSSKSFLTRACRSDRVSLTHLLLSLAYHFIHPAGMMVLVGNCIFSSQPQYWRQLFTQCILCVATTERIPNILLSAT